MLKLLIPAAFLLIISCSPGCGTAKINTRINDIDSVIRIVSPDHNCGCNYGDKTVSYLDPKEGKNVYFWQSVYIKDENIDYREQAGKIKNELVKLMPALNKYPRLYIEYRKSGVNPRDTAQKYTVLGSAFFLRDKCEGFVKDMTAKDLIKKSHRKKFENSLCEKK